MDKLVLTNTGGFPLKLDDLLWMDGRLDTPNKGIYDAIQAHLLAYGTDYIVEGATYAAPNVTAGWIMLAGELMRVDAHAGTDDFFVRTVTFDARGVKTFKDSGVNNTYEKIRGVLSGASGSLNITTADRLEDKIIQLLATSAEQFDAANIPNLDTAKITTGVFATARLPPATTTTNGVIEIAIQTEVNTGTDVARMVSPATLRGTVFIAGQLPTASESAIGALEIATTAEARALTATDKIITPEKLADVNGGLLTKVVAIGDWDMDTTPSLSVTYPTGVTFANIRTAKIFIINDASSTKRSLEGDANLAGIPDGTILFNSTSVFLGRTAAPGLFDGTDYDATSFNRGDLIIEHVP